MDFGILPPEIISALIHSGPGAWSWIEAAGVWQELSIELEQSAAGYAAELASLTGTWSGPSSMAMAQAVEPYLAWMRTTAQQCQQIASSVQVVTAAFELTHWTVVHPSVVAANRARLALLLATNFFGINLPAIAETEAEYEAMWVNNAAAMYRYAATSASAVKLPQFSPPPPVANPVTAQASVVPAGTTAGSAARTAAMAAAPLAAPTAPTPSPTLPAVPLLQQFLAVFNPQQGWFGLGNQWGYQLIASGFPINLLTYVAQLQTAQSLQAVTGDVFGGLSEGGAAIGGSIGSLGSSFGAAGLSAEPTAAIGVGVSVGKLTAPPAVVGLLPTSQAPVQLASAVSPLPTAEARLPMMPPLMPPPRGSAGGRRRGRDGRDYENIEYGLELPGTVMRRPPSAG